ncbi:asparaginase [Geodermatophilus sp. SYSU D00691]
MTRRRVSLYSLGGTIASVPGGGTGVAPRLGAAELLAAVPGLADVARVDPVAFRQVPSGELTLDDAVGLAAALAADDADGVVVVQGTDTLEEIAFALDLLVRGERPMVLTGAMRHPGLPGADGPANVHAAVTVAADPAAAGLGALVVAADEVHAARFVRKAHAQRTGAFTSLTAGPVGWVAEGRCRIALRPPPLPPVVDPAPGPVPPVALVTATAGDDGRLLGATRAAGYAGLVVAGFGGGHVPSSWVPALTALAAEVPVVLAGRTGAGEVLRSTYGFAGSETDLLACGLVPAGFLDGPKARVLLSLVLACGGDPAAAFARVAQP